ncbi:putative I ORF A [Vaccinia virus Copenhagen]|uniref:Uncharacterized 9.3 kDa protein n=5 Tax=Vaccinia virus TaxID=10245 RepID=YVIA_VACCC|nr:RecName: Full=Uncharacterized 9.3 kDa protein [Vaccinia virus Copenhagen]AAF33933.1 unknown [Vaccinia virus Tian Tan]AAW23482.1 hypothetical protein m8088R [Vaccinia virus]ABZ79997.1 unknown [synthetic Vaccinia virus]BBD06140.1 putative I ORF A [BAC cloning vector pLC16m8.8S-BAC]AAA48060.1 putative I ORF A [Vaccinia virus Copenhagen]
MSLIRDFSFWNRIIINIYNFIEISDNYFDHILQFEKIKSPIYYKHVQGNRCQITNGYLISIRILYYLSAKITTLDSS